MKRLYNLYYIMVDLHTIFVYDLRYLSKPLGLWNKHYSSIQKVNRIKLLTIWFPKFFEMFGFRWINLWAIDIWCQYIHLFPNTFRSSTHSTWSTERSTRGKPFIKLDGETRVAEWSNGVTASSEMISKIIIKRSLVQI